MQPYVGLIISSLAESEQQSLQRLVRHFQRRKTHLSIPRVALIAFASPQAMLLVAVGDKNNRRFR